MNAHLLRLCLFTLTLLVAVVAPGCTPLGVDTVFSPVGTTTVVFMVRHAERDPGFDAPLNAEGLIRAQALTDELADEGVTAIFMPDFIRNRQTAAPLIEALDPAPTVRVYSKMEAGDTKALANRFVEDVLRDHADGVVLWIGNTGPAIENVQSGNLQEIFARFGGTGLPPTKYESLFKIVLTDSAPPQIIKGIYGGPSSLD